MRKRTESGQRRLPHYERVGMKGAGPCRNRVSCYRNLNVDPGLHRALEGKLKDKKVPSIWSKRAVPPVPQHAIREATKEANESSGLDGQEHTEKRLPTSGTSNNRQIGG